ncbi:hypothetical protein pb186bvf_004841 [Paramecium bursaria]
MDNWLEIQQICQDEFLAQNYPQGTEIYSILYANYINLRNLLKMQALKNTDQKSYLICQQLIDNPKLLKIEQYNNPYAFNLYLIASKFYKYGQIYMNTQLDLQSSRLALEYEFQQQKQILTQKIKLKQIQNLKKVKIDDQFNSQKLKFYNNVISFQMAQSNFIVINGPVSCGKTYIVNNFLQNKNQLTLYMDPMLDFNSLVGQYVCTQQIGVFKHGPGPLLICNNKGYILILKNFSGKRALKLQYVLVGNTKHYLHNIKVIAIQTDYGTNRRFLDQIDVQDFSYEEMLNFCNQISLTPLFQSVLKFKPHSQRCYQIVDSMEISHNKDIWVG